MFLVIQLSLCPFASADEIKNNKGPVHIEADTMDYSDANEIYHARGAVVITYDGGTLTADDVEYDKKNSVATASGNALLKTGKDTLAGDKIIYNTESETGVAYQGRAFYAQNHFYIRGDRIEKTGEFTYTVDQPVATTCDGDKPAWEIAGSEMKVTIEGYGLMKNARFVTNNVPVLYTPFLLFPAKTKRQSGFLFPYLSYSADKDGIDVELPYFWAISPQMDATFYQRYLAKRGFKEGAELRYYVGRNSFGTFYGDYIEDGKQIKETNATPTGTTFTTSRDWQDAQQRWSYYLNHQTNFDASSYLRTDLRRVSDNWYFRDFAAHNYYRDHYALTERDPFKKVPYLADESLRSLESTARFFKGWSNYNLTALISYMDDFSLTDNNGTLQKYPEINFTAVKQPLLKSPVYYEFAAVYDYFYREVGQRGHAIDMKPTFSLPFNILRYARVTPQLSLRETLWLRDDEQRGDNNEIDDRTVYNFSLAMSSQVSRIFDVKVQNWDRIRHEIKPEITYSYTPYVEQSKIPNYLYYTSVITPSVTPNSAGAAVTNAVMEQNAFMWGATNTFTAKLKDAAGNYSYLEFLRVKLLQVYDIKEAKRGREGIERRPLGDMWLEVDLSPHPYLSFAARNQYSVYTGWTVTNYDLNIKDWRGDNLTVGYRYTYNSIEELNVYLKAVITKKLDSTFIFRQDKFNNRIVENTIGLLYKEQCWALGLDVTKTEELTATSGLPGASNEKSSDTRFVLKLWLTGLGQFGL